MDDRLLPGLIVVAIAVVLLALALAGCATAPKPYIQMCPNARDYSRAEEQQAQHEMAAMPPPCDPGTTGAQCSMTREMIRDYGVLRTEARGCTR